VMCVCRIMFVMQILSVLLMLFVTEALSAEPEENEVLKYSDTLDTHQV